MLIFFQIQKLKRKTNHDEKAKNLQKAENYRIKKKTEREREQTEKKAQRKKLDFFSSTAKISSSQLLILKFLTESAESADTK